MVPEGDLANALSVFSGNSSASVKGDQDVGPLVLHQSRVRSRLRCSDRLLLRLGWVSLSCLRILLFDRAESSGRRLDARALHVRFRPGDIQLLRAHQSGGIEYG